MHMYIFIVTIVYIYIYVYIFDVYMNIYIGVLNVNISSVAGRSSIESLPCLITGASFLDRPTDHNADLHLLQKHKLWLY